MPHSIHYTYEQIVKEAHLSVTFLEETTAKYPKWIWPKELMPFAKEFLTLIQRANSNYAEAVDFTRRIGAHIRKERLKGLDEMIWLAEAFTELRKDEKSEDKK